MTTSVAREEIAQPLGRRDQLITAALGVWMVIGLFLDGWAHDNQKPESFFTLWHGVLYSGFTVAALFAFDRAVRARTPGTSLRSSLPPGHGLTLVALGVFAASAIADLAWHELFGVEVGIEALLSPTHLALMAAGLVALSAPARALWISDESSPSLRSFLPAALSATLLTALVTFFLLYLSPFSNDAAGTAFTRVAAAPHDHPSGDVRELQQVLGVASIVVMSMLLATTTALLLRRWHTPTGTFLLLYGVVVALLVGVAEFRQPPVVVAGIGAGLVADALCRRRLSAAAVCGASSAALWLCYFALYAADEGAVAWPAELWAGTTFLSALLAGAIGFIATPLRHHSGSTGSGRAG